MLRSGSLVNTVGLGLRELDYARLGRGCLNQLRCRGLFLDLVDFPWQFSVTPDCRCNKVLDFLYGWYD